jgi:hypothetical protein
MNNSIFKYVKNVAGALLVVVSVMAHAQTARPVPGSSITNGSSAANMVIPLLPSDICTASNANCFNSGRLPPSSNGASGSQCGWVPFYSGNIGPRLPCNGNTLAMGNSPVCPAGATLTAYDNKCKGITQGNCGSEEYPSPCDIQVEVPAIGYSLQPATYWTQITDWNCPAGYSPFNVISSGGSNENDYFYTCVKS